MGMQFEEGYEDDADDADESSHEDDADDADEDSQAAHLWNKTIACTCRCT